MNDILANVLIQPKVVTGEGLKFLTDHMRNSHKEQMSVFDAEKSDETRERQSKIDLSARNVKCADLLPVLPQVKGLLDDIVKNVINPFYGFEIRDSEEPQLLCYEPGGHYKPHNDAEGLWTNPDGTKVWKKTIDRDLSTVLFLNDDFEGGEFLMFNEEKEIKFKAGDIMIFPSVFLYPHRVAPVTKGIRDAFVSWVW